MKFEIKGSDFPLTAALLTHTERRLRTGLARDGDRIKRVVVTTMAPVAVKTNTAESILI